MEKSYVENHAINPHNMRHVPHVQLVVIADDLTGCGDVAYWADAHGISCVICTTPSACDFTAADVVIVNTDTRHKNPDDAYRIVHTLCTSLQQHSITRIFKKIDSALRGNIGVEHDALFDVFGIAYLPFMAAYPEYGRTTREGMHSINGELLHTTAFARDPKNPVTCSHIPTLLRAQSRYADATHVLDATTEQDMKNAAAHVVEQWNNNHVQHQITSGTSKWFDVLCTHWANAPTRKTNSVTKKKCSFHEIIVVVGSHNPVSRAQAQALLQSEQFEQTHDDDATRFHFSVYRSGTTHVVITDDARHDAYSLTPVAAYVKMLCSSMKQPLVITCGGDTSTAVCAALGITTMTVVRGVVPGIVVARDVRTQTCVMLKPGGFGENMVLTRFMQSVFVQ